MKLKFVSGLVQIASLRFIEALEGSKITIIKNCMSTQCCVNQVSSIVHAQNMLAYY